MAKKTKAKKSAKTRSRATNRNGATTSAVAESWAEQVRICSDQVDEARMRRDDAETEFQRALQRRKATRSEFEDAVEGLQAAAAGRAQMQFEFREESEIGSEDTAALEAVDIPKSLAKRLVSAGLQTAPSVEEWISGKACRAAGVDWTSSKVKRSLTEIGFTPKEHGTIVNAIGMADDADK